MPLSLAYPDECTTLLLMSSTKIVWTDHPVDMATNDGVTVYVHVEGMGEMREVFEGAAIAAAKSIRDYANKGHSDRASPEAEALRVARLMLAERNERVSELAGIVRVLKAENVALRREQADRSPSEKFEELLRQMSLELERMREEMMWKKSF